MGPLQTSTQTYSGGTVGSTIPGQAQQQNQQMSMQLALKGGQTLSPQATQAAQQGYLSANNAYVDLNSPQARQQALSDTQLGGMQQNYNDLAQQLASYDNAVLKPQFAGQNPGMPSDIQPNGDVTWGDVSYLTPGNAGLPAAQGIFNANPAYALNAQASQGNNILALLNTLNDSISKESQRGYDIHGGKLKSAAAVLQGFSDILDKNMQLEEERARLAASQSSSAKAEKDDFLTYAEKVKDDLQRGAYSAGNPLEAWGKAYQALRTAYPGHSDQEIDAALGGSAHKDEGGNWVGANNASKEALIKFGLTPTQVNTVNTLQGNLSVMNDLKNSYSTSSAKGNPIFGGAEEGINKIPGVNSILSYTDPNAKAFLTKRNGFLTGLKNLVGESGVLTNQDVDRISGLLPNIGDNPVYAEQQFSKVEQEIKRTIARTQRTNITLLSPDGKKAKQGSANDGEVNTLINQGWKVVEF